MCRNFSQRTHPIHPIGPLTHIFVCFIVFGCIWDHFVTAWNSVQNELNWCNQCKSLCHEVVSEFFTTNALDPPHWTLNPCLGPFHSVWVHLGSFHYYMKLCAKLAELVQLLQKFVPQSRVRIFTMNALDPPHWTLNSCFRAFHSVWVHLESFRNCKLGAKRGELAHLMQKFVPRSHIVIFSQRTHSIHPIGP